MVRRRCDRFGHAGQAGIATSLSDATLRVTPGRLRPPIAHRVRLASPRGLRVPEDRMWPQIRRLASEVHSDCVPTRFRMQPV